MKKKSLRKLIYLLVILLVTLNQLGSLPAAFADKLTNKGTVYHNYDKYLIALDDYNETYAQYEKELETYKQDKQEYDQIQASADQITKANAAKKEKYENDLAVYQTKYADYTKQLAEVQQHSSAGQYIGPNVFSVMSYLESYLVNYSALTQMTTTGLSLSGTNLINQVKNNMATDIYTGSETNAGMLQSMVPVWQDYADFIRSIYGEPYDLDLEMIETYAVSGAWYDGFNGVEFYHTYSSNTGQTKENIPATLDHPTEAGIQSALDQLFIQTNGAAFDSGNSQMTPNTYLIDQTMANKWTEAVNEAKKQGFDLYGKSLVAYQNAFIKYNQSDYQTAAYDTFMADMTDAIALQRQAMNLIGGMPGVTLEDGDNQAPFSNDLANLSASELANKYGYLLLLSNMASKATYGYFHLLTPQAGETINVATASSRSIGFKTTLPSKSNYEPSLTEPVPPTPPIYAQVPIVPQKPIEPTPPIKPTYEPINHVSLLKVDQETNQPLSGAVFALTNTDTNTELGEYTTNEAGVLNSENLFPGNYTLTEIHAPAGYLLDKTPVAFTVKGLENEKVFVEKANVPITGSVILTKTDATSGTTLKGAVFDLVNNKGTIVKSGLQTNNRGEIVVSGLHIGTYQFVETNAPTGYDLNAAPVRFVIKKGQTDAVHVTKTNKLIPGEVVLTKIDEQSKEKLAGAIFELQNSKGEVLQKNLATDASGKLAIADLAPDDYQLVETTAPTGYQLDQTPLAFTIKQAQSEALQLTMSNQLIKGGVVLTKLDGKTNEALQGALFELQDSTGKMLQTNLPTDEAGKLTVTQLTPGMYQFVEIKAPTGYKLNQKPVTFTIQKGQTEVVQVTKTNQQITGGVVLQKTDEQTGASLAGAQFELQDKNGKTLEKALQTDETGKIAVNDLEPDDYQLVETKAPAGYILEQSPVKFTIKKGQKTPIEVKKTNKAKTATLRIEKKDSQTKQLLANAEFQLKNQAGEVIKDKLKTDESGTLELAHLKVGDYQLIETKAPANYKLDATPTSIQVNETDRLQTIEIFNTRKEQTTLEDGTTSTPTPKTEETNKLKTNDKKEVTKLPQTGQKHLDFLWELGLFLIMMGLLLFRKYQRKSMI